MTDHPEFPTSGAGPLRVLVGLGAARTWFRFCKLGDVLLWARHNDELLCDTASASLRVEEPCSKTSAHQYRHLATVERNRYGEWFVAIITRVRTSTP